MPSVTTPPSCPARSAIPRIGVRERRLRKPVWMSRARSVPAFIVANSAPWMNGTASAKATKELVGKPGSRVSAFRPPELTASSSIGKTSGPITFAGCRIVRTTERRASRKTWSAKTLIDPPRDGATQVPPTAGFEQPRRSRYGLRIGIANEASNGFGGELSPRRLGFVVVGSLERAAGLRQEDIVERRLVQPQVRDFDSCVVECPDHVGEAGVPGFQAHGDTLRRAAGIPETG